jgi:hypothetical protein
LAFHEQRVVGDIVTTTLQNLKRAWWWLSDSEWRRAYAAQTARIGRYHRLQRQAVDYLVATFGARVLAGPFSGMSVGMAAQPSSYCAHLLLGTYELELHGAIEEICTTGYSLVIDIGASDGYYVCGLKRRMPQARVVAFETMIDKHADIRALARENGVDAGVSVQGHCDAPSLRAALVEDRRPLVVCDIEGGEVSVLDLDAVPELTRADLLVETHDGLYPGCTDILRRRFARTHDVRFIQERPRTVADAPAQVKLPAETLLGAMDEFRGGSQSWLWMVARRS